MQDKIIWQSKWFPKFILTQSHLEILRYAFPSIKHFEPQLKEAELWLFNNPERRPKKNWKRFLTNWVRNSVKFAAKEKERNEWDNVRQGDAARKTDPKLLKDILKSQ
jgi:hypothetical protein